MWLFQFFDHLVDFVKRGVGAGLFKQFTPCQRANDSIDIQALRFLK
jgi:hypothetical protein